MGIEVDTSDWKRAAAGLRNADKDVKKAINTSLRKVGVPAGKFVAVSAGHDLPQRGGLGYAIGGAKPGLTISPEKVSIRWNVPGKKWYLARLDEGLIKHPIFGQKNTSVEQKVRAGTFRRPFDETAPIVRRELVSNLETMLSGIGTVA